MLTIGALTDPELNTSSFLAASSRTKADLLSLLMKTNEPSSSLQPQPPRRDRGIMIRGNPTAELPNPNQYGEMEKKGSWTRRDPKPEYPSLNERYGGMPADVTRPEKTATDIDLSISHPIILMDTIEPHF